MSSRDMPTEALRGPDSICGVFLPSYGVGADGLSHCSILAKESAEVAEELLQLRVVHGLMVAVGNLDHLASQRHASISLEVSVVVYGRDHHSTWSLPRAPEQKGSLHCGFFSEHRRHRLIHKCRSNTSFRKELYFLFCLPPSCHKQGAGKPTLALAHLFYPHACCG